MSNHRTISSSRVVDFFIVGAPKAGTSSLYHYFKGHPDVVMSEPKEPNYFTQTETKDLYKSQSYKNRFTKISTDSEYHSLFSGAGSVWGECSVSYLYYEGVAEKIKEYNPAAKIIICLRDPIDRFYSHYDMDRRLGFTRLDVTSVLKDKNTIEYQQYVDVGKYSEQVKRYLNIFDADNIRFIWFEDLKSNSAEVCLELCEFLGVRRAEYSLPHRNKAKETDSKIVQALYRSAGIRSSLKKILPAPLRVWLMSKLFNKSGNSSRQSQITSDLYHAFHRDIVELEKTLNHNLNHWKMADSAASADLQTSDI